MLTTNPTKTKIIIVGAGPAGLTLGVLLERAGIDYLILESMPSIRPLGSAIAVSSAVQPVFAQLGLLDEINEQSKPFSGMTLLEEAHADTAGDLSRGDKGVIGTFWTGSDTKERYGYYTRLMPRPTFYNILLKEIPMKRLLLNKKVVSSGEYESESGAGGDAGGVMVKCADGSEYHAQILVGADGAYSTIRNALYYRMKAKKMLPKQDQLPLKSKHQCVLGVTQPLMANGEEDERYRACFEDGFSNIKIALSKDRKHTVRKNPPPSYDELEAHEGEEWSPSKNSENEWGHEAAQEMLQESLAFKCPYAGTVGELVDRTQPHLISMVMLDEKLYHTWYHGRTVLIGDGVGAALAILDAVTLANILYDLPSTSHPDLANAFKSYYDERYHVAHRATDLSNALGGVFHRESWVGEFVRKIALGNTPASMMRKLDDKVNDKREQAVFLDFVPVPGLIKPKYQMRSDRKRGEGPLAALSPAKTRCTTQTI
ncbi:hypothetical protein BGX28_004917 [Mortierella sp. GBA30]|nr:hypothetical protein BGX28_004917 [Mortierella sp. GBA30]